MTSAWATLPFKVRFAWYGAVRILGLFVLLQTVCVPQAGSTPPTPGESRNAQIKADLSRILSQSEFRPTTNTENAITRSLSYIGEQWREFMKILRRMWDAIFGISSGLHGTPALQWMFVALFLGLGVLVVVRLLHNAILSHAVRQARRPNPSVEELPANEHITTPEEWLQRADEAARRKSFREAYRALYMATLLRIARSGAMRYEPAHTNGEVLETLETLLAPRSFVTMKTFTREYEDRWFGATLTAEQDYNAGMALSQSVVVAPVVRQSGNGPTPMNHANDAAGGTHAPIP